MFLILRPSALTLKELSMSGPAKKIDGITKESTQEMIDKALEVYPEKAKKKRAPHLAPNDPDAGSAWSSPIAKRCPAS